MAMIAVMDGNVAHLLRLSDLARELRLSKSFLEREVRTGRIPSLRAGKVHVFNLDAVRRVLLERAGQAVSDHEVSPAHPAPMLQAGGAR